MAFIYALIDPFTDYAKYIGKTSRSLSKRFKEHLNYKRNTKCGSWVNDLLKKRAIPKLELLEEVQDEEVDLCERFWIASLRAAGAQLLNITDGGDGISKGFKHGDGFKIKRSIYMKGNTLNKGRIFSKERKSAISEHLKGNKNAKGLKHSADVIKNIKERMIGNSYSKGVNLKNKYAAKLNQDQVNEIRLIFNEKKPTYTSLAKKYGVSIGAIRNIIKMNSWK